MKWKQRVENVTNEGRIRIMRKKIKKSKLQKLFAQYESITIYMNESIPIDRFTKKFHEKIPTNTIEVFSEGLFVQVSSEDQFGNPIFMPFSGINFIKFWNKRR